MYVRAYEERDRAEVERLFLELVETHRSLYPDGDVGSVFEVPTVAFVAEDEGEVIGYAGLEWHGRRAELEPIVVARSRRGIGAGRALVQRVVEEARSHGAVRVFARPVGRNAEAIRFFHAVGLDTIGRVELQVDLEPRERRGGETLAQRPFRT